MPGTCRLGAQNLLMAGPSEVLAGDFEKHGDRRRSERRIVSDAETSTEMPLIHVPGPEGEGAAVREEDLAVVFQVVPHLRAAFKGGEVGIQRLHLDDAALGLELEERGGLRAVLLEFLRGEQAAIRDARAVVGRMDDGGDLWLQRIADGIEELGERRIAAGFRHADDGDEVKLVQVIGDGVGHAGFVPRIKAVRRKGGKERGDL